MCSGLTCGDLTCGGLICRTTSQAKPPTTNSTNKYPNVKQLSWARVPHHHHHSIIIRKVLMINGIPGDQLSRTFGWFGYLLISTWKKTIIQLIRSSTWSIYWFQLEWSNTNVTDFSLVVVAIVIVLQVVSKFYLHLHRAPRAALCSWAALRYYYLYKNNNHHPPPHHHHHDHHHYDHSSPSVLSWALFLWSSPGGSYWITAGRCIILYKPIFYIWDTAFYHFYTNQFFILELVKFLYHLSKPVFLLDTFILQFLYHFIQSVFCTWNTIISVSFYKH